MTTNNESLNERRARVEKLQANAGRKISRNKRDKDVVIEGTQFDPRTAKDISRMRARDLAVLERRLTEFNSRKTQFEAGSRGAPLPRQDYREYKKSEQAVREKFNTELAPHRDVKLPGPGDETVGIRQDKMRTKHPTALNMAYVPPERQPFNIKDFDALKKLTAANKKRLTPQWEKREERRARKELKQMVEVFEDKDLNAAIKGMTKGQFHILWNLTNFADKMSITYHHYQKKYTPKQRMPQELIDNELAQAKTLIGWVKQMKI